MLPHFEPRRHLPVRPQRRRTTSTFLARRYREQVGMLLPWPRNSRRQDPVSE